MPDFEISSGSGFLLRFLCLEQESVKINIRSDSYEITKDLYLHPNFNDLDSFFNKLAEQDVPWSDEIFWQTIEQEFKILARCDSLGHVCFKIEVRNYAEDWCFDTAFGYDFGMLKSLGTSFSGFWKDGLGA